MGVIMVKNILLCLFVILLLGGCGLEDESVSQPTLKVIEENKQIELDELKQQREVETKTNNPEEIANEQEKDKEDVKSQTELNQEKQEDDDKKVVVKSNDSGEQQSEKSSDAEELKEQEEEKVSTTEVNDQKVEDVTSDKEKPKPNTETDTSTDKPVSNKKITWDVFFDNGDQTQPSENFWNLKGSEVVIDGFMGEVLNIGQGWFLLIPAPGAECPFDNGDATYWNKIMIVFVKDKANLRFTGEPLRITGRLDVGVKVDESNYKTMFRLYDATIEKR